MPIAEPQPDTALRGPATVQWVVLDPPIHRDTARAPWLPYLAIARPDHWFKNVFMALGVVLAFFCHPELLRLETMAAILWAVLTTCILASSNYVLNEILDAPTDRLHPQKRHRPIPAGQVRLWIAWSEWIILGVAGLGLAALVNGPFLAASAALLGMGMLYNIQPFRLKEWPYVDVLSESINNPIRLLLGWFALTATELPPLSLLVSYWMIGAFFMAAKRFAEYRSLAEKRTAAAYRRSFQHYDENKLLLSMVFYVTCFALCLGVFIIRYHLELMLSFPLIAGFICYYLAVALKPDSAAQHPERLFREKGLMAYLVVCVVVFVGLMCVRIPACHAWTGFSPEAGQPLWRISAAKHPDDER